MWGGGGENDEAKYEVSHDVHFHVRFLVSHLIAFCLLVFQKVITKPSQNNNLISYNSLLSFRTPLGILKNVYIFRATLWGEKSHIDKRNSIVIIFKWITINRAILGNGYFFYHTLRCHSPP